MKSLMAIFLCFKAAYILAAPAHFGASQAILKSKIYPHKGKTFYCNCSYQKNSIETKSCALKLKKHSKRQKRLEWEHVVPVSAFGHSFKEYREAKTLCKRKGKRSLSPRKCAKMLNPLFATMTGDLHNLVPVVGAINALRSNFSFAELSAKANTLCGAGFKLEGRKVAPPETIKGDIARIYFYMNERYPNRGIISQKNSKLFASWDKLDPVSFEECELHKLKAENQGNSNPFVAKECEKLTKASKQ